MLWKAHAKTFFFPVQSSVQLSVSKVLFEVLRTTRDFFTHLESIRERSLCLSSIELKNNFVDN